MKSVTKKKRLIITEEMLNLNLWYFNMKKKITEK